MLPKKKNQFTPRSLALEILLEWQKTGSSLDSVWKDVLDGQSLSDPRDRQLLKALVYGVVRQLSYLDWVMGKFSRHPLNKIKPLARQSLRLGILQLLFMDRVPARAAIHQTVEVLKERKQPKWLTGFVNGILRSVDRQAADLAGPDDQGLPTEVRLNHPDWLVGRWQERYGAKEMAAICARNNRQPELCLRIDTSKTSLEEFLAKLDEQSIEARPGDFLREAVHLPGYHGLVTELPGYVEGFFHVQDEMAQLVVLLLGSMEKGSFLDGCAGLGGKTMLMAHKMGTKASLTAVEPQSGRQALLAENLQRAGLSERLTTFAGTLAQLPGQGSGGFDGILIDAPCSGLGVCGRHPDIRWNRQASDLKKFHKTQTGLLSTAAGLLNKGGCLVYVTCSMEPEEDQEVIKAFLESQPNFTLADCRPLLPENATELVDQHGFFQTRPGVNISDGFFAARLEKI